MPVTIGNQGSKLYVELKHGEKAIKVPCKDKDEAQQIAAAAAEAEKKIEEKEALAQAAKTGTTPPVDLTSGTPPAGVGEKVNTVA